MKDSVFEYVAGVWQCVRFKRKSREVAEIVVSRSGVTEIFDFLRGYFGKVNDGFVSRQGRFR